jgi:hypothetical protein
MLVYNRALTQAEVLSIFQSATPLDYTSDKRIIFAAATPSTVGSYNALTVASSGSFRNLDITVSLDLVSATGSNLIYGPTEGATHMFYGSDVNKLQGNEIIATSSDLTSAVMYSVTNISDIENIGRVAFANRV